MLFVCWLFRGRSFGKPVAKYDERHVEKLESMLRRHGGHDLLCIHDGTFSPETRSLVMPEEASSLTDYMPKLWAWSPEFHEWIGHRFASIDLDVVITDDIAPALETKYPFRIWDRADHEPYNSSLFVLEPGYGHQVWETLSAERVAAARARARKWCGDQSWIAHVLGPDEQTFGESSGIMQYRPKLHRQAMPDGMKAGFMCGPYEPFSEMEQSPWLWKHYR